MIEALAHERESQSWPQNFRAQRRSFACSPLMTPRMTNAQPLSWRLYAAYWATRNSLRYPTLIIDAICQGVFRWWCKISHTNREHNMSTAKTVEIKCKHHVGPGRKLCGATRMVAPQDVFQVKRCIEHQQVYAAEQRRARAKAERKAAKEAK